MEKAIKKTTGKLLAGFLAVLMVLSVFTTLLCELDLDFLRASAAGDDTDVLHTNTAYSNTEYSVLTGNVAMVGNGFGADISADLQSALGTFASVKQYASLDAVLSDSASVSLVVYACGTDECVKKTGTVSAFGSALTAEVSSLRAAGLDVLLVTPGPIVEYGAGMYYATHSDLWTPEQVAAGDNVSNRLSDIVAAVESVAASENVGVLSLYGKAKLSGESDYMQDSADGIYPAAHGRVLMTRWIAEYISEHYVIGREAVKKDAALSGTSTVVELSAPTSDVDAVVLSFAAGASVPEKVSVQTTKAKEDQWFEAVADVELSATGDGVYTISLVFSSATAQYVRITAEGGTLDGATASVYKTALVNPVVTYPVAGDNVSTKHAFNVEWSAVSGADRYSVVIADASTGATVRKFTTSEDTQAIPAGVLTDGGSYNIKVTSIRSGYIDEAGHSGSASSGVFAASATAPYSGNSETVDESVSSGKLVTVGEQAVLSVGADVSVTTDAQNTADPSVLTDGAASAYAGDTSASVLLHTYGSGTEASVVLNLGKTVSSVSAVYFDAGFFAANMSANAKPVSVIVSYSTDGVSYSTGYKMSVGTGVRTIPLASGSNITGSLTRFSEGRGYFNVQFVKLSFTFDDVESSNFYLDEVYVVGSETATGSLTRDGAAIFNEALVGASYFDGAYTSGAWVRDSAFAAVSAIGSAVPTELFVDLNTDLSNNTVSTGNHTLTAVDIAYAVDVDAVRPSSIVVSVRKEGETTWTDVGGKVYVTNGTVGADSAAYVVESIPLTMADGSDVVAAYVKITLYSNIYNTSVPSSFVSEGKWGTWFAISHLDVRGGQYIGSIEADGATAAYHANYLQNTALVGRDNFGDVNATDIWNTISWKTAPYTTSDSGYLQILGNVSVGKIYWASQTGSALSTGTTADMSLSAVNNDAPAIQTKAASNIAPSATYAYSGAAPNTGYDYSKDTDSNGTVKTTSSGYSNGKLNDGVYPGAYYPGAATSSEYLNYAVYFPNTSEKTITFKLDKTYNLSKVVIDYFKDTAATYTTVLSTSNVTVKVGSSESDLTSVTGISTSTTTRATYSTGSHRTEELFAISFNSVKGKYVQITLPALAKDSGLRLGIGEVEIYGESVEPTNVAKGKSYMYSVAPFSTYSDGGSANVWHTGLLTDGNFAQYRAGLNSYETNPYVGYISQLTNYELVVDLAGFYDITSANIELYWKSEYHSNVPTKLNALYSTDGSNWNDMGSILGNVTTREILGKDSEGSFNAYTYSCKTAATAKYVKFVISTESNEPRLYIDEIEIYGVESDKTDFESPVVSSVNATGNSATGFTVTAEVSDNVGVTSVLFSVYNEAVGESGATTYTATLNGSTATAYIPITSAGYYIVNVYAYDAAGNCGWNQAKVIAADEKGLINLAPYGTYAYKYLLPAHRINYYEGQKGAALGYDYVDPCYANNNSMTTKTQGSLSGQEPRSETNVYDVGKLNDGRVATYSGGIAPYYHIGWAQNMTTDPNPMVITFDLGAEYSLSNVYFHSSVNNTTDSEHPDGYNTQHANEYVVTYYFSKTGEDETWTSVSGTWTQDGTIQWGSSKTTQLPLYKNSATAPTGNTYRFVKISIANNSISDTKNALIYIDEVFIYGKQTSSGTSSEDFTIPKNWALADNGGQYKGDADLSIADSVENWTEYHDGKLNDGFNVTTGDDTSKYIAYKGGNSTHKLWFKLGSKIDISSVVVYSHRRWSDGDNYLWLSDVSVKVSDTEVGYDEMSDYGSTTTGVANGTYTKAYTVTGEGTGRYVCVEYTQVGWYGYIIEVEINGVKAAVLDSPVITSHGAEQEIGKDTTLEWEDVTTGDNTLVYYDITVTDANGNVVTVAENHSVSNVNLTPEHFALGEGYYTVTVTANADGWLSGSTELVLYYAPTYILTFTVPTGAQIRVNNQTTQSTQISVYEGSTWASEDVLGAIAAVVALPYTDSNGTVYYFNAWADEDGGFGIPDEGEITSNRSFYGSYSTVDTNGTLDSTVLTDGEIYDGRGNRNDFTFLFTNDNQSYDYVILDLGDIYYALTEFDVSFYKFGDVLPFQITFEVSSKLYVPTLSQGASFDDSDWQFVSVVQSDNYVYDKTTGRYSFADSVKNVPIIDGAYGRYVKVTFYYAPSCEGVYVDEIMVSGSDDYQRTNIAEEKAAYADGVYRDELTDGYETTAVDGKVFNIELDSVLTGLTSFALIGADNVSATFSISAGGDDFVAVETLSGVGGVYSLSDKVSARRIRIELAESKPVSEIRVYGDPGLENFYYDSGVSADVELKSASYSLDNLVSISAVDAKLYGTETAGTSTMPGASGTDSGFAMTDGSDSGYANGVSYVTTSKGNLWYGLYASKKGISNLINANFVVAWKPTLDSTAVSFTIGTKTYKFEYNGDANKGFAILQNGSAVPDSYSVKKDGDIWEVEFTVAYADVSASNVPSAITYAVTAYEGASSVGGTGNLTFNADGTTAGWNYTSDASSWSTLSGYAGDVVAWMELDRVYYGLNGFSISVLHATNRGYVAPDSVRFQVSTDNSTWTDVGYVERQTLGDYRYYEQYQPGEAYIYNFNVSFEGVSAKYVRAVMEVSDTSKAVAVQEFYVNALSESPKASGGSAAFNSFDYKMLWDDNYLYIALQYEEDEIPFYTASHDYYETYSMTYNTAEWNQNASADHTGTNAFAKSSLYYNSENGMFQLSHDITRLGDENTTTLGYSSIDFNNMKLYKVSNIAWNQGYTTTAAGFKYGVANLTSTIETSLTVYENDSENYPTLAASSVLNGYIIVSDGYALSQNIAGDSLIAKPITVDGTTIPASQITNDLVWFFEESDKVVEMSDYSKSLGEYLVYGFRRETAQNTQLDRVFFDNVHGMEYNKYYLTRAYQGMLWENVYTFSRYTGSTNTLFNLTEGTGGTATITTQDPINNRRYHGAADINWNVVYDSALGAWSFYTYSQGIESYNNYLDNVDGRSSFRLYMSVANLNDTARYDYENYDFVLDTYILDDATITLRDGTVVPVTEDMDQLYKSTNNSKDVQTAWDGYKLVEFKSTALGMTYETNEYQLDVSQLKGKAKMTQSENGQNLITVEIAIPFTQLGFTITKNDTTVTKWGNYYTKMGIEKPLGKRTLMQFDSDYIYTADNKTDTDMSGIDEFYYYVDASEFGYVLQMAPEGKGYQDLSYTDGEGYSTISSVRGEVLNTTNGTEIEYTPTTFTYSKIHSTNGDSEYAATIAELKNRDAFAYVEEDGIYYLTSQLDHDRVFNQGGTVSTELIIPAGGAYFSFDWKVQSETSDTLSVWLETTDTWNAQYKSWIDSYNCGIPYQYDNGTTTPSVGMWVGVGDYFNDTMVTMYSQTLSKGYTSWKKNGCELKNDACMAFISGYMDYTREPEGIMLASWKEKQRSVTTLDNWTVNVDDVVVFSPIVSGNGTVDNGMYRHVWDWNNVTMWIPNTTGADLSYTVTWMYWKNGSDFKSFNASDGRGTDDAQIANFRLSTTDELGYWKTSENWDTLRLDATVADPTDTMLGVKDLASAVVKDGEQVPAINASTNNPDNLGTNTFGNSEFLTLSYAAIAATEEVGTTTKTTTYFQTKNRINVSASNVPASDIEKYINNAIVFTQEYDSHLSEAGALLDWTVLELVYNTSYNTWVLNRLFEEGVDKSKFNIYPDNNTIIIAVNYTYDAADTDSYGHTREAVLFGYANREVLEMLTPSIRYKPGDDRVIEVLASSDSNLVVTQFITSNIFIRENYNVALGKMYSLRNYPTYWDDTYMYTENWFRNNNTEDALAAFLAVYSETPLYYVDENDNVQFEGKANTDGDYREAFVYSYSSNKKLRFDTNQYGNVLYVPAGVGQLTDGLKMSVYSDSYYVEALEDYAIGYFVIDGMGTPDVDVIEDIDPNDKVYSYTQTVDSKHDSYEVSEDVRVREENIILDLGSVEYGLSAFKLRFLGGGEDGVVFPTSVEFAISTDGLSYSYIGSVALDDTGFNSAIFEDGYASIIYTGATDTIYGNTVADYTFDLQTEGVTARYVKATIMNHSAQDAKTFISEFQVIQNAIYPDILPNTNASTWVDVSEDAVLMYQDTLERWDNILGKEYSFVLAPTQAGYLFALDEGYPDDGRANTATNTFLTGQLTDGIGGTALYQYNYADAGEAPSLNGAGGLKEMSVGWMKAYAAEVSLTFDMGELNDVGYVSVYAFQSKDSVDKITMPYNVTAYVSDDNATWRKVATVNAKDNDSSEVSLKGLDVVLDTEDYTVYRYNLTFARDGELGLQLNDYRYVKVVAETDGGEDGWICLTEVEVYEGHPCYPVVDLTDSRYEKNALGLTAEEAEEQESEVRPTFFRGYYDSELYYEEHYNSYYKQILDYYYKSAYPDYELPEAYTADIISALSEISGEDLLSGYDKTVVYNDDPTELYTTRYVFGNVEQRALDGRGVPYFYGGDQLLLRVTTDYLSATEYNYKGDWVSTYKLLADSRIYYSDCKESGKVTTRIFTTTSVPTPMTICNVLARDKFTCELPTDYIGEDSYYYLPIYLMNSLDYLKAVGYNVDAAGQNANYITMPTNKVELTGTVKWDTNYESDYDEYADDQNGVSLNIAPLGAKTNLGTVTYNNVDRAAETTLRFGSIWYIDDAAYYNTHTHKQQYGTLLMTLNNLSRFLTDTYPSRAKYTSVYEEQGLLLTELEVGVEVTGVEEITGVTEVIKLSNVTEVLLLSGVTETDEANAKFTKVVDGEVKYYTCDQDITVDPENDIGNVWKSGDRYFYCENENIGSYKYTTDDGNTTRYWYCSDAVNRANYVDDNGHWYSSDASIKSSDNVHSVVLNNDKTVYYYSAETIDKTIKIVSRDVDGVAHYWTCDGDYPSWTYTTIDGNTTRYWYSSNYEGIAGAVVVKDGKYYATSSNTVYNGILVTVDGDGTTRYWSASTEAAFEMLSDLQSIITVPSDYKFDEEQVMAGVERYLEYINNYATGKIAYNPNYLTFGGIVQHSRANKYYYYSNVSTYLVPENYDDAANNPFYGYDSNNEKQNMTDLLGVYNYDQRYLEFDAIIAGIPASQKDAKIVAIPYAIYANNYEFLEFGEHLGEGDAYVEETWGTVFGQYYGSGTTAANTRYYVYGGAVARSIEDVLNAQSGKQYD